MDSIILQNTNDDAWTGKIIVTKDGVKRDLICIENCTNAYNRIEFNRLIADYIDVDGNADSMSHAPFSPWCLNGNACKIVPETIGKKILRNYICNSNIYFLYK